MKATIIAAALACVLATPAFAKVFELPDANPAVTVDLPNRWKPSETDHGVEATSPDNETYVALETATAKGMNQLIDEDLAFLTKSGVTIDRSTQQTQDTTTNGIPVSFLHWTGKDKDGPTGVTLGIFGVSGKPRAAADRMVLPGGRQSQWRGLGRHPRQHQATLTSVVRIAPG